MRARALVLLTGLALTAGACATVESTGTTPGPTPEGPPPAPVPGYDWFYHADEATARLAYGLAESDDLKLALECERASGRLLLNAIADKGARPEIHVESGGETGRFRARSEPSQIHDGVFLTAEAPADEAVFQRFRRTGWLAQWRDGERETYAPQPQSAPDIERFFSFCG